jgi:4-hydroxy-2-oxoheptanedioate aldolase
VTAPRGLGAAVTIPYAPVAEWLVGVGYQWIVLDAEHSPIGPAEQLVLVTAVHAAGAAAYVRVPANDPRHIGMALDVGADGVIVPDITTADQAARAAASCRYPPDGHRSIGPIRRQAAEPCCIVQIESTDAVANAPDIAGVHGVDALMLGPGDLALGAALVPGLDSHHPTMRDLGRQVREATASAGRTAGTFALLGLDDARQANEQGWDFLVACLDRTAITSAAAQLIDIASSGGTPQ